MRGVRPFCLIIRAGQGGVRRRWREGNYAVPLVKGGHGTLTSQHPIHCLGIAPPSYETVRREQKDDGEDQDRSH
jgi:hypothetical protein